MARPADDSKHADKPACEHLAGYWINRERGNFRCYACGYQLFLHDLKPTRRRRIETWRGGR